MKQWYALYVFLYSYGTKNSLEYLGAFYITPGMHDLISIFRCKFVSVSNIEQKCMDFHEIFRIGQTLHKEQPGEFCGRSKPPCRCRKFSGEFVYILCVCVRQVGVLILIDCFVSGYTNFLFCFCSNMWACYNHSHSQQYFTCIMLTKISHD